MISNCGIPTSMKHIERYLENLEEHLEKHISESKWDALGWLADILSNAFKRRIMKRLRTFEEEQFNCSWIVEPAVQKAFRDYFEYSLQEIEQLNNAGCKLDIPTRSKN